MDDNLTFFFKRKTTSNVGELNTTSIYLIWNMTSISENGRQPQFLKMEDDLNFFGNRRQPHFFFKLNDFNYFSNGRRPNFILQKEEDLNFW